ncbi:Elongation factor Ts, mitochondrial [Malassezia vespertilionis]|uniref:Elongation factor Ts, mitochondrial n=1 Tax=Malassezia vespertilionis TaxID=2020962 RepID=A0A2N1JFA0_9BASI|nr:Elongation factor Ts, mitochondrial [Malassezia vespertilionis]PKI85196.1 Tsf1p [Malassezia vespertilionis]WFD05757.1 Elongation factor Ts, mitochondrial [Malassezia vespertilionis]
MLRFVHAARVLHTSARFAEQARPAITAIAELRRAVPGTALVKAREALVASRTLPDKDDVGAAVAWLEQNRKEEGTKRAAKVSARTTAEGVVACSVLSDGLSGTEARAALIELNCETDFVARNELFGALARDIAHTAAWLPLFGDEGHGAEAIRDVSVAEFLACPIVPYDAPTDVQDAGVRTVGSAITEVIARLGEKIALTRIAATFPGSKNAALVCGSFAHGAAAKAPKPATPTNATFASGRVASLLLVQFGGRVLAAAKNEEANDSLLSGARGLVRSLARQAAGFPTSSIAPSSAEHGGELSTALLAQPFAMLLPSAGLDDSASSGTVQESLQRWAAEIDLSKSPVQVHGLRRWEVAETSAPADQSTSFADEVKKAAGL